MKNQSPPKSPYPYNRHSEVCSIHCGSNLKNQVSPVTKPRVNPPRQLVALNQPASQPTPPQMMRIDDPGSGIKAKPPLQDKPKVQPDHSDNAALLEFENFLQQSGQNSLNASFTQFDSFSQKKVSPKDALDEALRESEQLSNYLEGTIRGARLPRDRENIFKA